MRGKKGAVRWSIEWALCFVWAVVLWSPSAFGQEVTDFCCPPGFAPGQLIVGFQPGTTPDRVEEIATEVGVSVIELLMDLGSGPVYMMDVPVGEELFFIPLFEAFPEVIYAQPNYLACIFDLPPCWCCPSGLICTDVPYCPVACAQGDCNGDGLVTTADVTCMVLRIFGTIPQVKDCEDCNGDGQLNTADVTCGILCIFDMCPSPIVPY